jgi:hypothetical protein
VVVARVQRSTTQTGQVSGNQTITLSGVAAGNLLAIVVEGADAGASPGAGPTFTVSDAQGAYVSAVRSAGGSAGNPAVEILYLKNTNSGSHTATVAPSSATTLFNLDYVELSGADTVNPLHDTETNTGADSHNDALTTSANVVAGTGELILAAITDANGAASWTQGSGYTLGGNWSGAVNLGGASEDKQVSASESPTFTNNESTGASWWLAACSFKPAASAATKPEEYLQRRARVFAYTDTPDPAEVTL